MGPSRNMSTNLKVLTSNRPLFPAQSTTATVSTRRSFWVLEGTTGVTVLSVLSQQISVDGYAETDPTLSTSLAYPQQDFDSLIGSAGWQVRYTINDHLKPYAKLTYDREFEDAPAQAFAQAQSMPGTLPYAVPGLPFDNTYGTLSYGVRSELFGLDITTGSSLSVGQKGANDSSFFLTVSNKF